MLLIRYLLVRKVSAKRLEAGDEEEKSISTIIFRY